MTRENVVTSARTDEIKEALRKMPNGKTEGTDEIPVEVWKCLGDEGLELSLIHI